MKTGIVAVLALTSTVFFASCGKKGLSDDTKNKMTTFENNWKTMHDNMTKWGETMNSTFDDMNNMMEKSMPMDNMDKGKDMKNMKSGMDMGMDSMTAMCNMMKSKMDEMKSMYQTAMDSVNAQEEEYKTWKKDAMSNKANDQEVLAAMDMWNAKVDDWNSKMNDWNTELNNMQTQCKNACDMEMGDMKGDMKGGSM